MSIRHQLEAIRGNADGRAYAASIGNASSVAAIDAKLAGIWHALLVLADEVDGAKQPE